MMEFLTEHWIIWVVGILAYAAGNHLGYKIGFNDGLHRAWELMTADQSPLGDKPKT